MQSLNTRMPLIISKDNCVRPPTVLKISIMQFYVIDQNKKQNYVRSKNCLQHKNILPFHIRKQNWYKGIQITKYLLNVLYCVHRSYKTNRFYHFVFWYICHLHLFLSMIVFLFKVHYVKMNIEFNVCQRNLTFNKFFKNFYRISTSALTD